MEGKGLTEEVEELHVLHRFTCHRDKAGESFKKKGVIDGIKQAKENNGRSKGMGWPVGGHK